MQQPWSTDAEPSTRAIELFLDDYERELVFREQSERELGPAAADLRTCLERWMAGGEREPAEAARARYVALLDRWRANLEEWVTIRGSGERLLAATDFMTDAQWARFSALQAREIGTGATDGALDRDQAAIRSLLPRFDAASDRRP